MKISTVNYYLLLAVLLAPVCPADAQTALEELEPEAYFDFWLGNWDLTWEDSDGTLAKGSNLIERILDQKVIKENFEKRRYNHGTETHPYHPWRFRPGKIDQILRRFVRMEKGRLLPSCNMVLCIRIKCGMVTEVEDFIVWEVK